MNLTTFNDYVGLFQNVPLPLMFLVCFGLLSVGAGFLISMPIVGNVVATLWITVMGEQIAAKSKGREAGTEMGL